MSDIQRLFERIDRDGDVDRIRVDIADAIARLLTEKQDSFGYWEKAHIAHAIAALAQNARAGDKQSTAWLRLSLVNLELASVPQDKRSEDYTRRVRDIESLTFEELLADARKLGAKT